MKEEKWFCDICKNQTENRENVMVTENPDLVKSEGRFFDVCDVCLASKSAGMIVGQLLGIESTNVQIELLVKHVAVDSVTSKSKLTKEA